MRAVAGRARPVKKSDFHYELPESLIAQAPLAQRSASRMLLVPPDSGALADLQVRDLPGLLQPGDLLVFNDTRVIPARLFGSKDSGGRVEILIERLLPGDQARAQVRASKSPRAGSRIVLDGGGQAPGEVVIAKARLHGVVDDARRCDVRDGAFKRLGHLDAHLAVVLGHDHQQAVAHVAAADLPLVAHAVGVGRDVLGQGAGDHEHHDLGAARRLQRAQPRFQRRRVGRAERAGLVDHRAGECGHGLQAAAGLRPARPECYEQYSYQRLLDKRQRHISLQVVCWARRAAFRAWAWSWRSPPWAGRRSGPRSPP